MSHSLSVIVVHAVFSTKNRVPWLSQSVQRDLHAYLATVSRNAGCECYRVGSVADHVHLALRLSRTITTAKLIETLKTSSSRWLKQKSPDLSSFAWQEGYGAFSIGYPDLQNLIAYIEGQEEHHKKWSFQDELRALLREHGLEVDETHLWD